MAIYIADGETSELLERYAARLGTNKTAALRELLRSELAEQDWRASAQQRYDKVMQWLGPRLKHPKTPLPKSAFDDLYSYLDKGATS